MAIKTSYPLSTIFVLLSSFFERFSFYAIRTLLPLYLKNALNMSEQTSTVIYHIFFMCCYFTPLLGAIVADSYIGNYSTIITFTVVFIAGGGLLSGTAIPVLNLPSINVFVYLGLALIAIGSGGVKPCISTFGGDQFTTPEQMLKLALFFSIFTWVGNAANLVSTFVTPILRSDIHCFGESSCFSLIFLLASGFLVLSLASMLIGKRFFFMKIREGNILVQVSKCVAHAVSERIKNGNKQCHWLDYSIPTHGLQLVADIKKVLKLLVLYLPLPVFWALFDQQGSRWTFQAERMSGDVFNAYTIKPDQFQVINRVMILLFIPLFEKVIYPVFGKCNQLKDPLQRILVGGILAALSFVASGILETKLENVQADEHQIHMMWQLPQYILMTAAEVMFQITGMEFSYSQAPSSMKSFMQAIWLLTSAVGNLLVAVIAQTNIFDKQSDELFLFAGIMFLDMIIFGLVAQRYNSTVNTKLDGNCDLVLENDSEENSVGVDNSAFEDTS